MNFDIGNIMLQRLKMVNPVGAFLVEMGITGVNYKGGKVTRKSGMFQFTRP